MLSISRIPKHISDAGRRIPSVCVAPAKAMGRAARSLATRSEWISGVRRHDDIREGGEQRGRFIHLVGCRNAMAMDWAYGLVVDAQRAGGRCMVIASVGRFVDEQARAKGVSIPSLELRDPDIEADKLLEDLLAHVRSAAFDLVLIDAACLRLPAEYADGWAHTMLAYARIAAAETGTTCVFVTDSAPREPVMASAIATFVDEQIELQVTLDGDVVATAMAGRDE